MALPACRERPLERLADLYTGLLHGADLSPSDEAVSVILLSAMQRKWRNALVKKRLEDWRRSKVLFAAFFILVVPERLSRQVCQEQWWQHAAQCKWAAIAACVIFLECNVLGLVSIAWRRSSVTVAARSQLPSF